jgi:MYXO-CTERM domain-containing protein
MTMKHTLFTFLAALLASPAFAGNLIPEDWTAACGANHQDCKFTFENGNLIAYGGEYASDKGCMWLYTSTAAPKMENNSSLAITLQFDATPDAITTIPWSDFTIIPQGSAPLNMLQVMKSNAGRIKLIDTFGGTDYALSEGGETTAALTLLTLNYTVENGNLCYTYTFNGETSKKMTAAEGINTSHAWQPFLAWDGGNSTAFTVTDVTFSTSSPVVPEPATATLSLLALAGLAARRRRATR